MSLLPARIAVAATLGLAIAYPVAGADAPTIPKAFQGHWEEDSRFCTSPSDATLTLTARELQGWESSGEVTKVQQVGPRAIVVTAKFEGEGETWTSSDRYELSGDGRTLTTANEKYSFQRFRCPGA